jgi:inosose dehydratase
MNSPADLASPDMHVANAPCSYGAFEFTVGIDQNVPDGLAVLDYVTAAGYAGIDLGPVGYLGDSAQLRDRLAERGLALAGGYVPLPFSEPDAFADQIGYLDSMLDILDAAPPGPVPARPTLADAGSPARLANPGVAASRPELGLDDEGWARFADSLATAIKVCRDRGYEPTFHHHLGTYIEAVWEIERVLELTDIGLCLDTGHLLAGGGEPVVGLREWRGRINHIHLKDAKRDLVASIVADRAPMEEIWRRRAFCALGDGDVGMDEVLAAIVAIGYAGWLVVEQDIFPDPAEAPGQVAARQAANRDWLRARGI